MTAAILVLAIGLAIFWLVFFRLKLLRLTPAWGFGFALVFAHFFLIFLIGLRFVTPNSANATVVQRTIQLIPRLPEPTLVTDVLVEENMPVKKGQPLFQFDRRPYEYKVAQLEAQLAEAKQNVLVLQSDVEAATQTAARAKVELDYQQYQKGLFDKLAKEQAVREEDVVQWATSVSSAQATNGEALAELERSLVSSTNRRSMASTPRSPMSKRNFARRSITWNNTTLVASEDGRIINLQVRPGMVSGIYRIGGIAALIVEADRYVLATYYQENLKYVRPGQPVEIALDLYPGQIFPGKVDSIWRGNGVGQYLPSDEIPKFQQPAPNVPQGQYAVKILLDGANQTEFPIGAQGTAAIYTSGEHGAWAALRKISIRAHSWLNWLYPINF